MKLFIVRGITVPPRNDLYEVRAELKLKAVSIIDAIERANDLVKFREIKECYEVKE